MRALTLALVVVAVVACSTDRCKQGTVFVAYTLTNGAEAADTIDVTLAVSGGAPRTMSVMRKTRSAAGSIEVDFAAYPSGQPLTLTLTARAGTQPLASFSQTTTASAGCTTLSFILAGSATDSGVDASTDLAAPPDLVSSPDLTPPLLCETVVVSTLAGNGTGGFVDGTGGATGTTDFNGPFGAAVDGAGNLYIGDYDNSRVRKITPGGSTSTLAGNGNFGFFDGTGGATGTTAFYFPCGVVVDRVSNVYVADNGNYRIRKVAPGGSTTTLAGNGTQGFFDGTGGPTGTTQFAGPGGVAVDGLGNVYVADSYRVREIAPDGSTSTLAGNGTAGFVDGTGGAVGTTQFNGAGGVAVDNTGNVYVADTLNNRIRKIAPSGNTTTLAGNGTAGFVDGTGGAVGTAQLNQPYSVALDGAGNVYVADYKNHSIRRVAPDGSVVTVAGDGTAGYAEGSGCTAHFNHPSGVAVSGKQVFVADASNNRIRIIQLP